MKLVLMSGYNTDTITQKIVELVGKSADEISVAILNECSAVENGDIRWLLYGFGILQSSFGGEIYLCDLCNESLGENKSRINKADIIYCFGGHVDYLQTTFDKSGFTKILPELLETKVWVGSSAGSCVIGKRPSQLHKLDVGERHSVSKYLELVNAGIRPHIWAEHGSAEGIEVSVEESKINNGIPVYALSDDSALIVEDNKLYLIGTKAQKIINGEVVENI